MSILSNPMTPIWLALNSGDTSLLAVRLVSGFACCVSSCSSLLQFSRHPSEALFGRARRHPLGALHARDDNSLTFLARFRHSTAVSPQASEVLTQTARKMKLPTIGGGRYRHDLAHPRDAGNQHSGCGGRATRCRHVDRKVIADLLTVDPNRPTKVDRSKESRQRVAATIP